MSAIAPDTFF